MQKKTLQQMMFAFFPFAFINWCLVIAGAKPHEGMPQNWFLVSALLGSLIFCCVLYCYIDMKE